MSETATEVQMDRMKQMKDLAKSNPDAYVFVFAWLAGAASANTELGEHLDKAIDYEKRVFPR